MSRIGINATFLSAEPTGISVYTLEVAARLLRLDGYVAYAATDHLRRMFPRRILGTYPSLSPSGRTKAHLRRLLWAQLALPGLAARHRLSLLYSTASEGPLVSGTPLVITVHDLIQLAFPQYYPGLQFYVGRVLPRIVNRAAAVIADSAHTKADLVTRLGADPRKISVVHPGVDRSRFRPQAAGPMAAKYGRYVLLVGDVRPHKNVPRALQAFDRLDGDLRLVVAGRRASGDAELERVLAGLRRPERVVFAGYVPEEELPQLYSDSAAFLFPSLYEGFGLPPLEAMACGAPVAASNASSIPEVCGDAARTFDPASVDAMEEALRDVLARPALYRERGLARAAGFSWDRTAAEVDAILRRAAR